MRPCSAGMRCRRRQVRIHTTQEEATMPVPNTPSYLRPTACAARAAAAAIALQVAFIGAALAQPALDAEPGIATPTPEAVGVDSAPLVCMSEWIRKDKLDVLSLLAIKDRKL